MLMPVKQHKKRSSHDDRAIINSEIICYPITNISRPLDMFGPFPKTVKSFVPVVPPQPPNRKSSRTNSTLKIVTHLHGKSPRSKSSACSKHDSMNVKFSASSLSKKSSEVSRSRSAGPSFISTYVSTLSRNEDSHTKLAKRICYRASSLSPIGHRRLMQERKTSQSPVAFGRGISKERAFAVEKKKVEEKLAKISKDLHVSTRILRNPSLRSPNEVKQAVQNTFKPIAYVKDPKLASLMVKKSLESQAYQSTTSRKASEQQKSLKVTVAISSRGREIMRTSTETPPRSLRSQPSNVSSLSSKSSTLTKVSDSSTLRNVGKLNKLRNFTSSNNSLARTNSTYSIDSNLSVVKKKVKPLTISSQKLKKSTSSSSSLQKRDKPKTYFLAPAVANNRKVMESSTENASLSHEETLKLENHSLVENFKKYGAPINPNSSVLEKARMWSALATYKSEPSLRHPNHYLHQSRPVSRSRFLRHHSKRNESECYAIFNNNSGGGGGEVPLKSGFVMEQIYKYDSLYQLSDEDEFGNSNRGRSLDFSLSYHERSNSEPPTKTLMTEVARPYSPLTIYGRNKSVESEKRQRSSRSPSCRRIQTLKTNKLMELSSYQKEIVRAQSVGRTERAKERLQHHQSETNLYRSKSLNLLNFERHLPICGHHGKSERFRDLRDFYACLERVGQLECATSHSDLRPRRRNEEIIDYDLWQKVREHEKNERELNILLRKLKVEQRDKDFLFEPHGVEEFRWKPESDLGLVTKEKSVENLKELFQDDEEVEVEGEGSSGSEKKKSRKNKRKKAPFDGNKDNYKPLWRASSVLDLASNMTQKYNKVKTAIKNSLPKGKDVKSDKNLGLSRKLLSTLSKDQLKKIKSQLTEIYASSSDVKEGECSNIDQFVVTVPPKSDSQPKPFLTVRSHSELTKDHLQEPTVDISSLKSVFESKSSSTVAGSEISESEKRSISQTLSQEIKDKFIKKKALANPDVERVKKIDSAIKSTGAIKTKQPAVAAVKRDISFTFQEAPPAALKYLADSLPAAAKKLEKAESISSETSNRTVIFRDNSTTMEDVLDKIKYFEEIEKEKEKVPTTIYHARDDSSHDEEIGGDDNATQQQQQQQQKQPPPSSSSDKNAAVSTPKLTSSQSFTDLKDLFGERSSMKSNENFGESCVMIKRSRSSSPNDSERCYKSLSEFGDVEKLKMKFENICLSGDDCDSYQQLIFSDSELNRATRTTRIRGHEHGNVSHIAHKYEMQSKRARSRTRRISPIPKHTIRKDDRLMPHINVISKTASLKEQKRKISTSNKDNLDKIEPIPNATGEVVAKIKEKFESLSSNLSLMGKMFTSTPDIRELDDISPHLSHLPYCGSFVSHKYPRPEDNNRSINSPDKSVRGIKPRKRPSSTSPIRRESSDVTRQLRAIFSDDQSYDNYVANRPSFYRRYLPDQQLEAEYLWQKKQQQQHIKSSIAYNKGHWQCNYDK